MLIRSCLAVLDFNHNVHRESKTTSDGHIRHKMKVIRAFFKILLFWLNYLNALFKQPIPTITQLQLVYLLSENKMWPESDYCWTKEGERLFFSIRDIKSLHRVLGEWTSTGCGGITITIESRFYIEVLKELVVILSNFFSKFQPAQNSAFTFFLFYHVFTSLILYSNCFSTQ